MANIKYFKHTHVGYSKIFTCECVDDEQGIFQLACKFDLSLLRRIKKLRRICEKDSIIINRNGYVIVMSSTSELPENISKIRRLISKFVIYE